MKTILLSVGLAFGLLFGYYYSNLSPGREDGGPVAGDMDSDRIGVTVPGGVHPGTLSSDEVLSAGYIVVDIPGKGKGAVAIRDIEVSTQSALLFDGWPATFRGADVVLQQGEEIMSEKPLFTVPPTSTLFCPSSSSKFRPIRLSVRSSVFFAPE